MRLLLVNPAQPESFWSFRWALARVLGGKRSLNPPLGLATLQGQFTTEWDVVMAGSVVSIVPIARCNPSPPVM